MSVPTRAIEIAAKWWADCLRVQKPHDNGDKSATGGMAAGLASLLAARVREKPFDANAFECEMRAVLDSHLGVGHLYFGVDYHPDGVLQEVIDTTAPGSEPLFPWKTRMHITPERVTVRCGYGAAEQVLWSAT